MVSARAQEALKPDGQPDVETHVSPIFWKLGLVPAPEEHRRVLAVHAFLRA